MALSNNKERRVVQPHLTKLNNAVNVAANTTIYEGAIVAFDASGNAIPAPSTGAKFFAGIAANYVDNATPITPTTTFPLTLHSGQMERITMDSAPAATDLRKPVFYVSDEKVSLTKVAVTGVDQSEVGILWQIISGTDVLIDTSKAVTA